MDAPNKVTPESLAEDFAFADESGEFVNQAQLLRYVAAINIDATRAQFVAAAVVAGYAANSSDRRFRESRHASLALAKDCGENLTWHKDGRLVYSMEE